jgi:hypothetical protein
MVFILSNTYKRYQIEGEIFIFNKKKVIYQIEYLKIKFFSD